MKFLKLKTRRGVGGLISLVALIMVFGIASVTLLELNSLQTNFQKTGVEVNNIQMDRIKEDLTFLIFNDTGTMFYDITITNIGSETSTLHSFIAFNNTGIAVTEYFNSTTIRQQEQNVINAREQFTFEFSNKNATHGDEEIIIVTNVGTKCIIPIPLEGDILFGGC